jgi:hypothetical protein
MTEGDMPARARKMIIEWASMYQDNLIKIWETHEFKKIPPLR